MQQLYLKPPGPIEKFYHHYKQFLLAETHIPCLKIESDKNAYQHYVAPVQKKERKFVTISQAH